MRALSSPFPFMRPTDEELMASYVSGNAAAFDELFARYAPLLLRVMGYMLWRKEDARDLVQETFMQLHRARRDWRVGAPLRPWLMTIALNLKREHFRKDKRRREDPQDGHGMTAPEPVAPPPPENMSDLKDALAQLSHDQREAIVLHWLEGLSFQEIADITGASTSAVKVRAHRGYLRLRELLVDEPGARAGGKTRDAGASAAGSGGV